MSRLSTDGAVPFAISSRQVVMADCQNRKYWACWWAVAYSLADVSLTLQGQPAEYFAGDFRAAVEQNPLFYPLLAWHPAAFLAVAVGLTAVVAAAIVWLPAKLSRAFAFITIVSHSIGAASWAIQLPGGMLWTLLLLVGAYQIDRHLWADLSVKEAEAAMEG